MDHIRIRTIVQMKMEKKKKSKKIQMKMLVVETQISMSLMQPKMQQMKSQNRKVVKTTTKMINRWPNVIQDREKRHIHQNERQQIIDEGKSIYSIFDCVSYFLWFKNVCVFFLIGDFSFPFFRWDETSDDDSGSMEPSNSENEHYSDHNRRPRRQAAVATKKKQAKRNAIRRKNYSSDDDSDSDDDHKRCVLNMFSYFCL